MDDNISKVINFKEIIEKLVIPYNLKPLKEINCAAIIEYIVEIE